MSDTATPTLWRSNPVSVFIASLTSDLGFFENRRPFETFVITFMQLVNQSSQSNDACLIRTLLNDCAIHSGYVGSGSYDRFPLSCEIALPAGDGLVAVVAGGAWNVTVSGYYTPWAYTS